MHGSRFSSRFILPGLLLAIRVLGQTTCATFPATYIPLASVSYVTAANAVGDHLVVGSLSGGAAGLSALSTALPLPTFTNQSYCDAQVQLASQTFFQNVYVPTAAERSGNYSDFAGLLVNANNQPYPNGIIPASQLGAVFAFRIGAAQPPGVRNWSVTGSMSDHRSYGASVLLPNRKVLIVGQLSEDLYDPSTGQFTQLRRHGNIYGPTATLLNDGRVLIVADTDGATAPVSVTQIYDPASSKFVATNPSVAAHAFHTATILADGRVLITGGQPVFNTFIATSEIFDPKSGLFSATGSLTVSRSSHSAALLQDGRVLVTGGYNSTDLNSAELFDPATSRFTPTSPMNSVHSTHFAILLPNNKVFIGGGAGVGETAYELYDPLSGRFTVTGTPSVQHSYGSATLLAGGQVLVEGGCHQCLKPFLTTTTAELYNPATGSFTPSGSMNVSRAEQIATTLFDGRVLVTGGYGPAGSTGPTAAGYAPGGQLNNAELYTPINQGLAASQSGLTFRAAQGGGAATQNVAVLSATDTIPFTVSVRTYSGSRWLKATPSSGTASPGTAPVALSITADATGLAAQDYYGVVTLTPTDAKHAPIAISIVLTIVPVGAAAAPAISPSGLVFLSAPGATPKQQTFSVTNFTSRPITFTASAQATTSFFDFTPKTGVVNAGQPLPVTVTASGSPAVGVYRGSILLIFGDNSAQSIDVLLVVSGTAGSNASREATGCTPTKLLPVFNSIGSGFSAPVAWPTALILQVVDDCGGAINTGSVVASFTNGDSPLSLLAIGAGVWSATWAPIHNTSGLVVRADVQSSSLTGTVQVGGKATVNPKVPAVAAGGVISSGDYAGSPALGLLVSIFGTALADGSQGNTSLPLPSQLGSTSVLVSGVQVPVLYVSDGQVNVLIPYEVATNAPHQLIVQRGNAISVPSPITILDNQPAILATAGNGAGQGHIYKIDAGGNQILAGAASPAKTGDVLVIYTVGLGTVTPAVQSGDPAPFTHLSPADATVTLTIGGQPAQVLFAGLTPGFAGLYQVNAVVPSGVTPGNQVPVSVSAAGRARSGNIFMAVQ